MKSLHFRTPAAFRRWLDAHHATETELWVQFYNVKSGRGGMVYRQALDEALCYGWIDGVRKNLDEERYVQRFTPRKKNSNWSLVNVRRVQELIAEGRMHAAGLEAFERRSDRNTGVYSFEQQQNPELAPEYAKRLKANRAAWAFFSAQPPGYRRLATWWVMSAKKDETRDRRLATLIEDCAAGRRSNDPSKPKG